LAEEGLALLEKAAGQGHAYAMYELGGIYRAMKEYEQARKWYTMGAKAGVPRAKFYLGQLLSKGVGVAADYPAAADWFRRAADAGDADGAQNLAAMYSIGRGRAGPIMPACLII
jgi:TPR repeat protein